MLRLVTIAGLIALVFILIRYRTNKKVQKWVAIMMVSGFFVYVASIMVTELLR